jgi:two-component system OmpR family response regulator
MTLSVFLVEDNLSIRDSLLTLLEEVGDATVVGVAPTESEANRWLAANGDSWHLAIVDLFLSEGSGMEVVKACTPRLAHQRVVVLTNYVEAAASRAMSQGADAVFDKTTQVEEFLAYVQMCGARQRQRGSA